MNNALGLDFNNLLTGFYPPTIAQIIMILLGAYLIYMSIYYKKKPLLLLPMGVAILAIQKGFSLMLSVCFGLANAMGFTLAIVLMAGLRERTNQNLDAIPYSLRGAPVALITAAILSMAFMGFSGVGN